MSNLVDSLVNDLEEVKPCIHPFLRFAMWVGVALAYGAGVVALEELRYGGFENFARMDVLFEISLMTLISITAGISAFYLCIPDMRSIKWLPIVPFTLLGIFILWQVVNVAAGNDYVHAPHLGWYDCIPSSIMFFTVPALVLTVLTAKRHATTRPSLLVAMNSLCVGAYGYVGVRLTCGIDDFMHDMFYHVFPFLFLGTVLGVLAKRFYRW